MSSSRKISQILINAIFLILCFIDTYHTAFGQEQGKAIKDREGNTYKVKTMPDYKQWMTENLEVNIPGSYCYGDLEQHCQQFGRLYTWESAKEGCSMLGGGWRLPTSQEWRQMAGHYGGASDSSMEGSKAAYKALLYGGYVGFNAVLGGNREPAGGYARLQAHGFYWTNTEDTAGTALYYNFGAGGQMLHCQDEGEKQRAFSVRCICDLDKPGK